MLAAPEPTVPPYMHISSYDLAFLATSQFIYSGDERLAEKPRSGSKNKIKLRKRFYGNDKIIHNEIREEYELLNL